MKSEDVQFAGKSIFINGGVVDVAHPVSDAFLADGKVIILFDPDSYNAKFGQFQNLIALSPEGVVLWAAELPTTISSDRYYRIVSRVPLLADSTQSFECEIDLSTGKIQQKSFFK
jgi:hypothetical protein